MVPQLPVLHGDLILDVFTHHSLTQSFLNEETPQGNSERLAILGQSVLDTIVTLLLFAERPMLEAEDLKIKHDFILSDESMIAWISYYESELKRRIRGVSQDVLDDPKEARFLFTSYVGAVCVQNGLQGTTDWISKLVKPNQPPLVLSDNIGNNPTVTPPLVNLNLQAGAAAPPPYHLTAPPLPTSSPGSPQGRLALLNQNCSRLRITLDWTMNFSGPQHEPRWEVKCMVNGVERGSGLGRNQKQAKETAARQVYEYMDSVQWNVQQPEPTT